MSPSENRFEALFAQHRSAAIPDLWPWQREILTAYEPLDADAAVELPTGTGKTLVGLLVAEDIRARQGVPVAYRWPSSCRMVSSPSCWRMRGCTRISGLSMSLLICYE
jgi:hypothetical protein